MTTFAFYLVAALALVVASVVMSRRRYSVHSAI